MHHRTPKLTILQQIEASTAAWAAERRIHEKEIAKELALRRKLLALVHRSADANIRALACGKPRDEALSARANAGAAELQHRWRK